MEDKRSTPSRVGMTPIIGIVIIVVMALAIVPILSTVSSNISLADALTILGQNGYVAYASPTGDLTVNGDLTVTGSANISQELYVGGNSTFTGNVTINGNLFINGVLYGANVTGGNLTQEDIEDYIGGLINDGDSVQTRITVTYQDATNSLDFVVDNLLGNITLGANTTGIYVGNITGGNAITVTGQGVEGANVTINFDGGAAPGGELGGTWANPTVDSGIHDDEYIELSDAFGGDVSGNYTAIVIGPNAVALGADTTGNYVSSVASGTGINISGSGAEIANVTVTATLGANITGDEIVDGNITEVDLYGTNAPTDNYILSYDDATGGFTWVEDQTASGPVYAPSNATYLVGSAAANLTNEIVVGLSPQGELGGTWANPTVDSGIHDDEYIELSDTFGGEVSGNYTNIVIDNDALDDQYYDSESDLTTLLNDNYYSSEANLTALLNNNYYSSEANLTALLDDDYIDEDQAFAGEVTGTYDATVVDNDALDDQYIELSDTFGGDVSGNYTAIVIGPNAVTLGSDTTGNYVSSVAGGAGISVSGSGAEIANVTITATLGANITGNEIVDGNITEADLYGTNAPTDNYILSYDDATGGFTWVQDQTGSGSFDATIQNVVTWGNNTNGNMTWTFDPSGNNVIVNIWPQVFNVSTGTLQEGGYDVLTINDNFGGDVSGTYSAIVIGNDAVDDAHINWGNLTDLGEHGTVTWGNLGEGELADSSIVSADIKDDTIDSADYASDSIDNEHINWANLTDLDNQGVVVWGNLGEGELADSSVVSADIKDDTIDSGDYAVDSIDEEHINWANMTDLGDLGVVTWGNLGEGELADDSIVSADIKDDTIDSADYNADSIDDEHINWGSGANQIDQTDIPNGAKLYFFAATIYNPDGIQGTLGNITIFPIEAESFPNGITFTDLGIKTNAASNYTLLFQEWTAPETYSGLLESVSTSSATEAEDDGTIANGTGGGAGDCNAGSILKVTLPTTDVDELVVWGSYKINDS